METSSSLFGLYSTSTYLRKEILSERDGNTGPPPAVAAIFGGFLRKEILSERDGNLRRP